MGTAVEVGLYKEGAAIDSVFAILLIFKINHELYFRSMNDTSVSPHTNLANYEKKILLTLAWAANILYIYCILPKNISYRTRAHFNSLQKLKMKT